jgi:FAD-dependent oxidoreductase family protein
MKTIREPSRQIPIVAEADVVVVGGGPGGLPAAIAAARHGAAVVLIERYGFLGGLATAGLVAPMLGHTASRSTMPIVQGLLKEITGRMHRLGGAPGWEDACQEWGVRFDAETLKLVADEMVQEAGVHLLLHSLVADTIAVDGSIAAVIVESKSGRQAVAGRTVIDATGDADVAYRAGAPISHGRAFDDAVEALGSFIHIGGIPELTDEQSAAITATVTEAIVDGKLHLYSAGSAVKNNHTAHRDHFCVNATHRAGDPTKVQDMTRMEAEMRRDAWDLVTFLRANVPGMETCYVRATSPQAGPRESRQVIGDYVLTGQDVYTGQKFADAVARGSWFIDIHCPLGEINPQTASLCHTGCPSQSACPFWAAEHDKSMLTEKQLYVPTDDWYDIPYRCLTPRDVDNLLVSGRCISATHQGMGSSRVMGTCMAIGQAAGTAAALAVRAGVDPRDVDVDALQQALRADGALV